MIVLLAAASFLMVSTPCPAQANSDVAQENAQLRQRVDKLEKQVEELKTAVEPAPSQVKGKAQTPAPQAPLSPAPSEPGKKPLWSNLDIQLYGYIKGDAAYDTSRVNTGNYMLWVNSEATNDDDDEFNVTANETRLGVAIAGPKAPDMETSGKVEFDFFGSGADENKAKIQMRHAYLQLFWPQSRFAILAGQTWDVISPLTPSTLNYTVLWDAGNIGYRRPQIRLTKDFLLNDKTILQVQGAAVRTIGRDLTVGTTTSETGEDAGFPTLQSRIGLTVPVLPAGPTQVGVSGHWGKEEFDLDTSGRSMNVDTWSMNLDLTQPVVKKVLFKGELFMGEDLNTYFGGIGQGILLMKNAGGAVIDAEAICARGGWFAFTLGPWDKWTFNTGAGIDDVDADDVDPGDRTLNRAVFGNALYALNKHVNVGFELSHWRTDYRGPGDADDVRVQVSLLYKF
jgi:hypothetical protein